MAVTSMRHVDDARFMLARNLLRAIGRPVIADDDLIREIRAAQCCVSLLDTCADRASFVQARHNNRDINRIPDRRTDRPPVRLVNHCFHKDTECALEDETTLGNRYPSAPSIVMNDPALSSRGQVSLPNEVPPERQFPGWFRSA